MRSAGLKTHCVWTARSAYHRMFAWPPCPILNAAGLNGDPAHIDHP